MDNRSEPTAPPTPTDDEVISTSTESDTFDTWTLVTDKKDQQQRQHQKPAHGNNTKTIEPSGIEILKQNRNGEGTHSAKDNDDNDEDSERHESLHEHDTDSIDGELSDGISIISESDGGGNANATKAGDAADATGRISPHPFLREHLNDLSFKFSSGIGIDNLPRFDAVPLPSDDEDQKKQVRQRRSNRRSCTPQLSKESALQPTEKASNALLPLHMPPIVVRGLTCLFYGCVVLVVLSFLGKLRHMAWNETLSGVNKPPMEQLEAKLSDIELQNNLMRAEIDLLSKQVNYLSSQKDKANAYQQQQPYQHYDKRHHHNPNEETARKGKAFKAWLGNGKTMEAVDITKEDLHRPYKCADGNFVEVAGMCVDNSIPNVESIVDEFGNVLNEALKEPVFDAEPMASEQLPNNASPQQPQTTDGVRAPHTRAQSTQTEESNKHPISDDYTPSRSRERRPYYESKEQRATHHQQKPQQFPRKQRDNSDEDDDDDDSKEDHKKRKNTSKEHKRSSNSKERRHHDHDDHDDSDEHRNKQYKKQSYSSKEHNRQHQNRRNSKEQYNNGEWQEQRMRQRENARQQPQRDNIYPNNKNWYIKRGDSREKIRGGSDERQH